MAHMALHFVYRVDTQTGSLKVSSLTQLVASDSIDEDANGQVCQG